MFVSPRFSKAALIALGYEEVALDDFWQTFLQELDALPNMEMGQLEVCTAVAVEIQVYYTQSLTIGSSFWDGAM